MTIDTDTTTNTHLSLRLLATTDIHMNVLGYDYRSDQPGQHGLLALASLIETARRETPNSLLLDNGDMLQGNPMGDHCATDDATNHPMIAAMNALAYDAGTLGNHDFDYGVEMAAGIVKAANHPIVSANITSLDGPPPAPPHVMLERTMTDQSGKDHRLRIGLFGVLPPQTALWNGARLRGRLEVGDILDAARSSVKALRTEGADLIIALCHSGIGPVEAAPNLENAAIPLASLPGIDAIVAGHVHIPFPSDAFAPVPCIDTQAGTIHGTPVVLPGFSGSHLGQIDLTIGQSTRGWQVLDSQARLLDCPPVPADPAGLARKVQAAAAPAHQSTLQMIRTPLGTSPTPLHSYFATIAPSPALGLIAQSQLRYLRAELGDTDTPLLGSGSVFLGGGRGGPGFFADIPAGPVTVGDLSALYPYPNELRVIRLTGAELKDWLERAATIFNQIEPGRHGQELLNPVTPSYNFDALFGISYDIDISAPPRFDPLSGDLLAPSAHRIVNLSHKGKTVESDDRFLLATNTYRVGGGRPYQPVPDDKLVPIPPVLCNDILLDEVRQSGTAAARDCGQWRLKPLGGTVVHLTTGPGARAHLENAPYPLTELGNDDAGFARFALTL